MIWGILQDKNVLAVQGRKMERQEKEKEVERD